MNNIIQLAVSQLLRYQVGQTLQRKQFQVSESLGQTQISWTNYDNKSCIPEEAAAAAKACENC